jgi:hypothetical protein
MLNIDCLCFTCQVCQITKKERKKYGLLPPKIAESEIVSLGHGFCGSGLTMGENSIVSSNKCVTIMALKPNQLHVAIHKQIIIMGRVHKVSRCQ